MSIQELHPRTAVINKKQKHQSKQSKTTALQWLAQTFPQVFDNKSIIRPLKIGIMDDILQYTEQALQAGISKSKLREAVVIFTRRIDYLTSLKAREMRIDLDGNPTVPVTVEEADRAAAKIRKKVEKTAKNAKKTPGITSYTPKPFQYPGFIAEPDYPSFYNERNPVNQKPAVVIKQKSAKTYDPAAVARLKEKLGLAKKETHAHESVVE